MRRVNSNASNKILSSLAKNHVSLWGDQFQQYFVLGKDLLGSHQVKYLFMPLLHVTIRDIKDAHTPSSCCSLLASSSLSLLKSYLSLAQMG